VRVLLPLYVYPRDDPAAWNAVAGTSHPVTVVVNVHDGPGERIDPAYVAATSCLSEAGVPTLGYVDLGYGVRPRSAVRRDIDGWTRYRVGGVFFDRVPSGADHAEAIHEALDLTGALTPGAAALNFGTRPDPGYADLAATLCTFEGPYQSYLSEPDTPDWPNAAHLVYGVPPGLARVTVERMRSRVSCGLVTELSAPNPYAGLPGMLR
jgi:hypothetical protein